MSNKAEYVQKWKRCQRCLLYKGVRHHVVTRGQIPADVLLIGEAPGKTEDKLGEPFIGRSGQLLSTAIQRLGIRSYCITNVVCCIPWKDSDRLEIRPPTREEAEACKDHITELVEICQPKVVILLGEKAKESFPFAPETFSTPLTALRHPSYILRNGGENSLEFKRFLNSFEAILELAGVPHVSPFHSAVL